MLLILMRDFLTKANFFLTRTTKHKYHFHNFSVKFYAFIVFFTQCRSIVQPRKNTGDVSRLESAKDILQLRKKDRAQREKKQNSRQPCRAPGSDLERSAKSRDFDRSHDVSREMQRNFSPSRFSLFHFQ